MGIQTEKLFQNLIHISKDIFISQNYTAFGQKAQY